MLPNVRHKKSLIELPGLVMLDHALSLGFIRQMLTSSLIFVPVRLERCEVLPNIGGTFLRLHNFKRQLWHCSTSAGKINAIKMKGIG